jgi:hypothetical protein
MNTCTTYQGIVVQNHEPPAPPDHSPLEEEDALGTVACLPAPSEVAPVAQKLKKVSALYFLSVPKVTTRSLYGECVCHYKVTTRSLYGVCVCHYKVTIRSLYGECVCHYKVTTRSL